MLSGGAGICACAVDEVVETTEGFFGSLNRLFGEVELRAVLAGEAEVAVCERIYAFVHELLEGEEASTAFVERLDALAHVLLRARFARALAHLAVVYQQELGVHPVAHELLARAALGLGDLVLVVDGDVVHAAAVDIERFAQVLHRHGGALDVPAGVAAAPGRVPLHGVGGAGAIFQRAKSAGLRFSALTSMRAPASLSSSDWRDSRPYGGKVDTS